MVKNNLTLEQNLSAIREELSWFEQLINVRLELHFKHECSYDSIWEITLPNHKENNSHYSQFLNHHDATAADRLLLMLLLTPHIKPQLLDVFSVKNATYDRGFTEFGGLRGTNHGGFLPTVETAIFLFAGDNLELRVKAMELFGNAHYFANYQVIKINDPGPSEPFSGSAITLSHEYVDYFLSGQHHRPGYNDFPAKRISTEIEWEELVLPDDTLTQLDEIKAWVEYNPILMNEWGFSKTMKPGYKSLFYGPPGTGKTLAACLIGKLCGFEVYRVDLSILVSKYIGETEKNLEKVFQMAEHKNWILFFDEADSLFGKRTDISNSHDRYANQETSYLLQRIEDFNGVVILASNLKSNMDEAFLRRFQSSIYFPVPQSEERLRLWRQSFSPVTTLEEDIDLKAIAKKYELTGGTIINVIRYCSLMAIRRSENVIRMTDVEKGISKERAKEGRMM